MEKQLLKELKRGIVSENPEKYKMTMCLAKLRKKLPGDSRRCRNPAYKLSGRCRLHGGRAGRPISSGKASKYYFKKKEFRKVYKRFLRDPEVGQLDREIAILRTLVNNFVNMDRKEDPYEYARVLAGTLDQAGKMVDRYHKIQGTYFNMHALPIVINNIVNIVNTNIRRCPKCNKSLISVRKDLFKSLQSMTLPDPDSSTGVPRYADMGLPDGTVIPGNIGTQYKKD